MAQDQIKARLTLDVTYDLHRSAEDLSAEYIRNTLEALVRSAMNDGTLSGDSALSVALVSYNVEVPL
jgi:hypothetical protein